MKRFLKWAAVAASAAGLACGGAKGGSQEASQPSTTSVRLRANASALTTVADAEFHATVTCGDPANPAYQAADVKLDQGVNGPAESGATVKVFEAVFGKIPVGLDCAFSGTAAEHRSPTLTVAYGASLVRKFASGEENPQVILVLQQLDHFTTSEDAAPKIVGLTASDTAVDVLQAFDWSRCAPDLRDQLLVNSDSLVVLNAQVADTDGDDLWFKWDDAGLNGTFLRLDWDAMLLEAIGSLPGLDGQYYKVVGGKIPSVVWIPPAGASGTATLTLTVKDLHTGTGPGAVAASSFSRLGVTVTVDARNAKSSVQFYGDLNHWPDILAIDTQVDANSNGGQVLPGNPALVEARIHDFDGDALAYQLTSDCEGAFQALDGTPLDFSAPLPAPALDAGGQAQLAAYFVPAAAPASGVCRVTLTVCDGRGGTMTGYVDVNVVKDAPVAVGPRIVSATATAASVGAGQEVGFTIVAASRYGSPSLTYRMELLGPALTAELAMAFGAPVTNATGQFQWTAPTGYWPCVGTTIMNGSETYYFEFIVTDAAAPSNGVPAESFVVIPVEVECQKQ